MRETETISVPLSEEQAKRLFGSKDANLRKMCSVLGVAAVYREGSLVFTGKRGSVARALAVVERLRHEITSNGNVSDQSLMKALDFPAGHDRNLEIVLPGSAGCIIPRTPGQEYYLKCIRECDVVFCIGPAGTGKTFLAVATAVASLRDGDIERIVVTRPAVEAGENLGFLPGDLQQKIDPYLRPIYDALNDSLTAARVKRSMDNGVIEVAPLAYMRGRTLNNACVILDEAQNTTLTQMKMFLTRLGHGSRAIVTGDITQIDLKPPGSSGLVLIQKILREVEGLGFVYLDHDDVVRHPLVQRIISAFEASSGQDGEGEGS
jgi:phosphate starvation-inducible PhoH-like protein